MSSPALPLPSGSLLVAGHPAPRRTPAPAFPPPAQSGAAPTACASAARAFGMAPYRSAPRRPWGLLVLALHLVVVWGLLQMKGVRQALHEATPLMVSLIATEAPPRPPQALPVPALPLPRLPAAVALPVPQVVVADAPPAPPPVPVVTTAPQPAPVAVQPAAVVAAPVPAAVPAPPAPPAPKSVAASALRYRVVPPVEVPLASRRLGESGTVALRVVFDVTGAPRQITLLRSSGHARLDEQALAAMRAARIVPYLDNGTPIEVSAVAQLAYELD